jgi:hypothetical protein
MKTSFLMISGLVACTGWLVGDEPVTPATASDRIERVATMGTGRSVHTATALRSGQVLLVGGMAAGGGSLASVELFDPIGNSVRELPPLGQPRSGHTATLLADGRVLVTGGYNGEYLSSTELFDPATGRFVRGEPLAAARSGHTATLLGDGRVLLVGGVGRGWTFLRSAEIIDPVTGRSEAVGSLSVPRESHTATLLADGRVLVVGGHNGRREQMQVHAGAEIFDPRTHRFEVAGSLAIARHKHDAVRLADGRVLVIAGADRTDRVFFSTTELYDPKTRTFIAGPSLVGSRYKINGTSVLLPGGDVLVTSGSARAEVLDRHTQTFRVIPGEFPEAYRFATATALANGDVLVIGGYAGSSANTTGVWRFHRSP